MKFNWNWNKLCALERKYHMCLWKYLIRPAILPFNYQDYCLPSWYSLARVGGIRGQNLVDDPSGVQRWLESWVECLMSPRLTRIIFLGIFLFWHCFLSWFGAACSRTSIFVDSFFWAGVVDDVTPAGKGPVSRRCLHFEYKVFAGKYFHENYSRIVRIFFCFNFIT